MVNLRNLAQGLDGLRLRIVLSAAYPDKEAIQQYKVFALPTNINVCSHAYMIC